MTFHFSKTKASQTVGFDQVRRDESLEIEARRERATGEAYPGDCIGLALSGGGIRSGTLNLGIIQGLARLGLLPYIDYLSTVSGGGYIGTWLHGVIQRYGNGSPNEDVVAKLATPDFAVPRTDPQGTVEDPIHFLRKYSNYLAPDLGLFSADFWTILVIWTRNTTLNQLILAPAMAVVCLLIFSAGLLFQIPSGSTGIAKLAVCMLGLLIVCVLVGSGANRVVSTQDCDTNSEPPRNRFDRNRYAVIVSATMLVISATIASAAESIIATWSWDNILEVMIAGLLLLYFFLQYFGGFRACYRNRMKGRRFYRTKLFLYSILLPAAAAGVTAGLLYGALRWIASWTASHGSSGSWHVAAWGPGLIMLVWLAGTGFHIGLLGIDYPDFGREWLSRVGAFLFIAAFSWAGLFAIFIFGPWWMSLLAVGFSKTAGTLGTGWIVTTISGVLAGNSARTGGVNGKKDQSPVLEWVAKIAPPVFMAGYLVIIGFAVHLGLSYATSAQAPSSRTVSLRAIEEHYWEANTIVATAADGKTTSIPEASGIFLAVLGAVTLLMGLRVNINEFSMHHFYKNRLVRCYLGASRGSKRRGSLLTGFDSCDDMPLTNLLATGPKRYAGPFPILNTTLNLNRGSDLAKQERKGSSFVFTPLYSGYEPPPSQEDEEEKKAGRVSPGGYRKTLGYSTPQGWDIGTCMAISGAAANPNWGFSTSAPVAFLLTVFDVRLGWWVGNTRFDVPSRDPGPLFALHPLLSELFAQTDSRSHFLNLSDGGHFENFGVYELIRRRVKYIIVGDGEQDNDYTFESLGGVVRKCRADFGVEIDIHPQRIRPKDGISLSHCVVGEIHYPETEGRAASRGWLLYLKSSITGDEPADILQYKAAHPEFPQDPTANQFFTESQFESYRRLGLHMLLSAFEDFERVDASRIEDVFEYLYRKWHPPIDLAVGVVERHAETYSELIKRLANDPDLAFLDPQVLGYQAGPAVRDAAARPPTSATERRAALLCVELIQLMENVWGDLRFSEAGNRENPQHQGWIAMFRFWARQALFQKTWEEISRTFNPMFQSFFTMMSREAPQDRVDRKQSS